MSKKDYNKYLRSPEWKAKKLLVLERDNYKCQQCGYTNNLHVHHLTYENVTNEQLDDLVTLCKRCHRSEHKKKVKNTKHFIKYYKMTNRELVKNKVLTKAEKAFLYDVLAYINIETGVITSERGIPMNTKGIMKVCGIGRTLFYSITSKLIKIKLLIPILDGNNTYYRLHSDYFSCR